MNILVLSSEIPATTNMAGSPRLFNLCRGLSRTNHLTLATRTQSPGRYDIFRADPTSAGVFKDIIILPNPPAPSWLGQQVHRLRLEAHFITRFRQASYHAARCRQIRDMIVGGQFDVLYVDGLENAQYVDSGLPCPAVMDLHDCVTMLYSRKTRMERRWLKKLVLYAETRNIARMERALSRDFKAIIVNSPVDETYFKTLDPTARALTIGNGVDSEFFHPSGASGDLSSLVFTGVMTYGPNEDAALYFAHDILPLIRQRHPGIGFTIVGKGPTEPVQALSAIPGIRVSGEVPDVRPYLETAGVFVCPLRWGAGVKNKLLAALAMGKPVVATRESIEGLDLRDEVHLLIADTPAEFAARVLRLIGDPEYARKLGRSGRDLVASTYSWKRSGELLEETLRGVVARPETRHAVGAGTKGPE
jgi:glycosyltransferase involved in cell wall biosynthesis